MDLRPRSLFLTGLLLIVLLVTFVCLGGPRKDRGGMRAFSNTVSDLSGQDHYSLGRPIMGRLLNETLRAELGRSSWKLLHTMVARFPKDPKLEQKTMLKDYIYLFARLYPCGECAHHFQQILEKLPPNVAGRDGASQWACAAHNMVNERLKKPVHECKDVIKEYDCGCGDEEEED